MAAHRRVLLVAPTGSGKTQIFSYVAKGAREKNKRVLVLAHRRELIRQISDALNNWNVGHGLILSGSKRMPKDNVVLGNVFSVVRRVPLLAPPDLIIIDETHHLLPENTLGRVVAAFPAARLLGVTATPMRSDSRSLGDCFDVLVDGPSVAELTELEWLSPTEVYAPAKPDLTGVKTRMGDFNTTQLEAAMDKPKITGSAVSHYLKLCPNASAIAFTVSIKHAKDVAAEFVASGVSAASVDGGMSDTDRDAVLNGLRNGSIKVVTSCEILGEGFDAPVVECAILLRPTQSLGLYLQQVGRAIRVSPGKTRTIILDHSGNTLRHGFIDEPRAWSLEGLQGRKKTDKPPSVRQCPKCFAAHRPAPVCPMCSYVYEVEGRTVEQVAGDLVKVVDPKSLTRSDILGTDDAPNERRRKEMDYLARVARGRGYKNPEGWAHVVVRAREAKRLAKARVKVAARG